MTEPVKVYPPAPVASVILRCSKCRSMELAIESNREAGRINDGRGSIVMPVVYLCNKCGERTTFFHYKGFVAISNAQFKNLSKDDLEVQ